MSFHNVRDPDRLLYFHHQETSRNEGAAEAPIVKVDYPIRGEPYWVVMNRTADYICKHPLIFSSEENRSKRV